MRNTNPLLATPFTPDSSSFRRRDLRALRRILRASLPIPTSSCRQENASSVSPSLRVLFLRSADGYSLRTRREFASSVSTISERYNLSFTVSNVRLHAGFPEFDDLSFTTSHFDRIRERLQGGNCFLREATVALKGSAGFSTAEFGRLITKLPSLLVYRQNLSRDLGRPPLVFIQKFGDKIASEHQNTPTVLRARVFYVPTLDAFSPVAAQTLSSFVAIKTVLPGRVFYSENPQIVLKAYFNSSWSATDLFPKPLITGPYSALSPIFSLGAQSAGVAYYASSSIYTICSVFDYLIRYSTQKPSPTSTTLFQLFTQTSK